MSLVLQTSHCQLGKGALLSADMYELALLFDKHRVVVLENVRAVFPRKGEEGRAKRKKMKYMEQEANAAM